MRILIVTQKVDKNDPILGFFHRWIEEFAKHFESIKVICLYKGEYSLPENVEVVSLGKEEKESRLLYIKNFYKYIFKYRKDYDAVFVHMNQEYILLGGLIWKALGKKVYMWRNHHAGNILTDAAAFFCTNVFCTSKYSYTAKYKKTIIMPVGIDIEVFKPKDISRNLGRLIFIARIAPAKNLHLVLDALSSLRSRGYEFGLDVYGDPLSKDLEYMNTLKQKAQSEKLRVSFHGSVKNTDTPHLYSSHDICVNMSSSGMYDKTIFEAMACGCLSVASNRNLVGQIDDMFVVRQGDSADLAEKLENLTKLNAEQRDKYRVILRQFVVEKHSLQILARNIHSILS